MAGPWELFGGAPQSGPWEAYRREAPPTRAFEGTPAGAVTGLRNLGDSVRTGTEWLSQRDPGIDYATGVPDAGLRAGFSFMSGEAEKTNYLDQKIGKDLWGKDSFGAYFVKPEGLSKIGVQSDKPVSLDEQTLSRFDLADLAGDAPSIVGGVGAGLAATGLGAPAGMALTALGAAGGKAYSEIGKNLLGYRKQSAGEIGTDIAVEGVTGGAGEGVVRTLKPIGRFLAGPGSRFMTPERQAAMDTALEQGFRPWAGQVTDARLLSRWQGMIRSIFGDLNEKQNSAAAARHVDDLLARAGPAGAATDVGEAVSKSIIGARKQFSTQASALYDGVDKLVGGRPIVPTKSITDAIEAISKDLPTNAAGQKIYPSTEVKQFVEKYSELGQLQTTKQIQELRTTFREAGEVNTLVPGLDQKRARELFKATNKALEEAASQNPEAMSALRNADAFYKAGIQKFDLPTVSAITRRASETGRVDPEMVVDYIIKPNRITRAAQIKQVLPQAEWTKVSRAHAEDLFSNAIKTTENPLEPLTWNGKGLRDALEANGRSTLEIVHGRDWVDDAYKLANSLMLVQKQPTSSGIVAANIALKPLQNLGRLAFERSLAYIVQQPGTLKYLTTGIISPNTRAGVEALARITAIATSLASDETGSARFTVTSPESPVPQKPYLNREEGQRVPGMQGTRG